MKLASLPGGPDGRLAVVSRDLSRAVHAGDAAPTLQRALETWAETGPVLEQLYRSLNADAGSGFPFDAATALAPLPRAWQWLDASAFASHGLLMSRVFGMDPPPRDRPLMYQGMSHCFLSGTQPVPLPAESDGIDFEGEFGVIIDDTPMGVTEQAAGAHIRLLVLINDWSLRVTGAAEMRTGFGWVQAKPACSMAPVAVTPDELGDFWREGRVGLPLRVRWNDAPFGAANGAAMAFSFGELIAHAARTRALCAGTVIGSGTVSNENFREVGSSCIAERRGIEILDHGAPATPFMRFGDEVEMEADMPDGTPLFGAIRQRILESGSSS